MQVLFTLHVVDRIHCAPHIRDHLVPDLTLFPRVYVDVLGQHLRFRKTTVQAYEARILTRYALPCLSWKFVIE